jgi:hypothetical protein
MVLSTSETFLLLIYFLLTLFLFARESLKDMNYVISLLKNNIYFTHNRKTSNFRKFIKCRKKITFPPSYVLVWTLMTPAANELRSENLDFGSMNLPQDCIGCDWVSRSLGGKWTWAWLPGISKGGSLFLFWLLFPSLCPLPATIFSRTKTIGLASPCKDADRDLFWGCHGLSELDNLLPWGRVWVRDVIRSHPADKPFKVSRSTQVQCGLSPTRC